MRGFHHFYLSFVFDAINIIVFRLIWSHIPAWVIIILAGILIGLSLWVKIDDIYQHLRQRKEPEYLSFLHDLYRQFIIDYNPRFLIKLNKFADWIFGG